MTISPFSSSEMILYRPLSGFQVTMGLLNMIWGLLVSFFVGFQFAAGLVDERVYEGADLRIGGRSAGAVGLEAVKQAVVG